MASVLTRPGPPPEQTIAYGDHRDQVYDVRLPLAADAPAPLGTIVVVHGGFWRPDIDRSHSVSHAQALADLGHRVVVVEYRRIPGDWEAMAQDLRAALGAVRAQWGNDLALIGHSAGGHLVAWALHQPEADGIRGGVALAGCVDLALVDELRLDGDAAHALMGTVRLADEPRWAAADPTALGPTPTPLTLIHGTRDDRVPLAVSQSYADRTGAPLEVLEGCDHFDLIDPRSPHWGAGAGAIRRLLTARTDERQ